MFAIALSIVLFLQASPAGQASPTGTVTGIVKLPESAKPLQAARVVLLPPKYIEVWNKQVQQRLDNYWELFKPEFAVNKEHFTDFNRIAYLEAFQYVASTMRRELGDGASSLVKESPSNGQFEFRGVPFGTYQILVQAVSNGKDVVWSRPVDVQSEIPMFVDLGKPVS
jgi:hypothetical protein